jgi:hypothetical protein
MRNLIFLAAFTFTIAASAQSIDEGSSDGEQGRGARGWIR